MYKRSKQVAEVSVEQELELQDSSDEESLQDQLLAQNDPIQSSTELGLAQNLDSNQVTQQIDTIDAIGEDQDDAFETEVFEEEEEIQEEIQEEESDEIEVAEVNEELPILSQGEIPADDLFSNNISQISPSGTFNNQVSSIGGPAVSSGSPLTPQVSGFGTGSILSTASNLTSVASLNSLNGISSPLNTLGQAVFSSAEIISPVGDFTADQEASDVDEIETYQETTEEEESTESYTSEEVYEEETSDENIIYTSDIVNPTLGNDTLEGGLGETEFLYDFSVNVGGVDALSDNGDNDTDRLFIKSIPEKHNILITKDLDNSTINLETFDVSSSFPFTSENVITTAISNGINGVEDLYLNTEEAITMTLIRCS